MNVIISMLRLNIIINKCCTNFINSIHYFRLKIGILAETFDNLYSYFLINEYENHCGTQLLKI